MPYCEKCGHKMSDDAVFCSKCGRKAVCITEQKTKECLERKSVTEETTVSDKVVVADNEDSEMSVYKKVNNKRLKLLLVIFLTVVIICFALFFVFRDNNKVITKNEDGETVFAFTLSEFVDRYNENSYNKLRVDDFEKSEENYTLYEDDFYLSIGVDKGNYPCYVTSVYISYYTDDNSAPEEVVNVVRAIYGMSEKEAHEKVEDAIVHGAPGVFDDTMLFLDIDSYEQTWHFFPDK